MNQTTRGHGKIAIEGDSIHFHFEPLKLEKKYLSKFELKSDSKPFDGSLTIKLSTYDITDSIPMEGVWVGWCDEESIPNEYFFTDEKGQLTMFVRKPMDKGFIRIRQMFYQELKIRLDTIKSISTEIKAYMNPSSQFVIENTKWSYHLAQVSNSSFVLTKKNSPSTKFLKRRTN